MRFILPASFLLALFSATKSNVINAIVNLKPTTGNSVSGYIKFQQNISNTNGNEPMTISGLIQGINPGEQHALNVHQFGDISSLDGGRVGGHYNPFKVSHGCPSINATRHPGDFGNLPPANGTGFIVISNLNTDLITLDATKINSILGLSIVLHTKKDDCIDPISGNAGAKIATGVIGIDAGTSLDYSMPNVHYVPATADYSLTRSAIAVLTPTNTSVSGTVIFNQPSPQSGVTVLVNLIGFESQSTHAIHIHTNGNIQSSNGDATGGHFNPYNVNHSCQGDFMQRHVGDFGINLRSDNQGVVKAIFTNKLMTLYPGTTYPAKREYAIGRGLIIHSKIDDCQTQPTGNAGYRMAQGVIGIGNATLYNELFSTSDSLSGYQILNNSVPVSDHSNNKNNGYTKPNPTKPSYSDKVSKNPITSIYTTYNSDSIEQPSSSSSPSNTSPLCDQQYPEEGNGTATAYDNGNGSIMTSTEASSNPSYSNPSSPVSDDLINGSNDMYSSNIRISVILGALTCSILMLL